MAQPLPQIDPTKCTGCARCVEACPEHVLELHLGKAVLAQPDLCTYCMACEEICPTNAIALPFEIVFYQSTEPNQDSAKQDNRRDP